MKWIKHLHKCERLPIWIEFASLLVPGTSLLTYICNNSKLCFQSLFLGFQQPWEHVCLQASRSNQTTIPLQTLWTVAVEVPKLSMGPTRNGNTGNTHRWRGAIETPWNGISPFQPPVPSLVVLTQSRQQIQAVAVYNLHIIVLSNLFQG